MVHKRPAPGGGRYRGGLQGLFVDVAVDYAGGETFFCESALHPFGHHHGAMLAAGATERDGEVAFTFVDVVGNQIGKKALHAAEKFSRLGEGLDVAANARVFAGEAAQLGNEVGIGQEAHVKHEVGVGGHSEFIAKTNEGNEERPLAFGFEAFVDEVAEFVNVELGGVNDHVGELADGLHQEFFLAEAFADGVILAEGMRAASFAVAAKERVFGGFDIDEDDGVVAAKMLEEARKLGELQAFAGINEQSGALETAFAGGVEFGEDGDEVDRKIVDAVVAHIFEGFEDGALAGAGESGEDDELAALIARFA